MACGFRGEERDSGNGRKTRFHTKNSFSSIPVLPRQQDSRQPIHLPGRSLAYRFFLESLKLGEPKRIAITLAGKALISVMLSGRQTKRSDDLMRRARSLAERQKDPWTTGYLRLYESDYESFVGGWRRSAELATEAGYYLRQHSDSIHWETARANLTQVTALFFLGEIRQLSAQVHESIAEADQRGDLYAGFVPRTYFGNVVWLAKDQVALARQHAKKAMAKWPREPFLIQHLFELIGSASIDLYAGDSSRALDRLDEAWPKLKQSIHLKHRFSENPDASLARSGGPGLAEWRSRRWPFAPLGKARRKEDLA